MVAQTFAILELEDTPQMSTDDGRVAMRPLQCAKNILAGLFATLRLTVGGLVAAHAAQTTSALTADQAIACIRTAVAAQAGMVTKMEVEHKRGQRLCEARIVDETGKRHKLQVDTNTNRVVEPK
jgi:hypothetical protein